MGCRILTRGAWALLALVAVTLAATSASAQSGDMEQAGGQHRSSCCPPPASVCPEPAAPGMPAPGTPLTAPERVSPPTGVTPPTEEAAAPTLPSLAAGVQGGRGVAYGSYIDSALIRNQVRFRYDAAYDDNRPDRAEFFYPKCGCFAASGQRAPGPPLAETRVDYQDITAYAEAALTPRFSLFFEAPYRFLNAEQNTDTNGFSDINAGFKAALISTPEQVLTFQFRTYIPTGDADRGLGTDHVSLEPAFLLWQQASDRLYFEAELRDWIPIGGTPGWQGNVLRYGVGVSYFIIGEPQLPGRPVQNPLGVAPVLEFVGWTVLSGKEFAPDIGTKDAAGDTIVNAKLGLRIGYGDHQSFAVSYGRALTGAVWYKDILRVEYRFVF
jgi:hypothetical protein